MDGLLLILLPVVGLVLITVAFLLASRLVRPLLEPPDDEDG